jgi:hypothetical protein
MPQKRKCNPSFRYIREPLVALGLSAFLLVLSSCTPSVLSNLTGAGRIDYNGRIVDKLAVREETDQGTFFRRILTIESANGDRFNVYVNERVYSEAQPGMWIKSNKSGVHVTGLSPTGKRDWTEGHILKGM